MLLKCSSRGPDCLMFIQNQPPTVQLICSPVICHTLIYCRWTLKTGLVRFETWVTDEFRVQRHCPYLKCADENTFCQSFSHWHVALTLFYCSSSHWGQSCWIHNFLGFTSDYCFQINIATVDVSTESVQTIEIQNIWTLDLNQTDTTNTQSSQKAWR